MKNLNTLIEQQKERVINQCVTYPSDQTRSGKEVRLDPDYLAILTTQTATLAYRQALEDVLAGLPGDKELTDCGRCNACDVMMTCTTMEANRDHNTTLQTVRAQIEGLLSKIE
jgi:hypothetical protein